MVICARCPFRCDPVRLLWTFPHLAEASGNQIYDVIWNETCAPEADGGLTLNTGITWTPGSGYSGIPGGSKSSMMGPKGHGRYLGPGTVTFGYFSTFGVARSPRGGCMC